MDVETEVKTMPHARGVKDEKSISISVPSWLAGIGKQSPLALVLLVILYFFRMDFKEMQGNNLQHDTDRNTAFVNALDRIDKAADMRTEKIIQSHDARAKKEEELRVRETDRMLEGQREVIRAIQGKPSAKPDGDGWLPWECRPPRE